MKIGVVGVPGSWSSEELAGAVEKKTGFRCLVEMSKVSLDLEKGNVKYCEHDLTAFDALIVKKIGRNYSPDLLDRLIVLQHLYKAGVKIFSNPFRIARSLDRLSGTVKLVRGGIPIPPTVITESVDEAMQVVKRFGKSVLKPLYTSKARGMKVLDATNGNDMQKELKKYKADGNKTIYIQKHLKIPGKDLGIAFMGNKYLKTYARMASKNSWNTTTSDGGWYEPYTPPDEVIHLAWKAQALFGLDFTCVDIIETPEGPKVFEVSAFGGFKGLMETHNISVADLYTEYVIKRLVDEKRYR